MSPVELWSAKVNKSRSIHMYIYNYLSVYCFNLQTYTNGFLFLINTFK